MQLNSTRHSAPRWRILAMAIFVVAALAALPSSASAATTSSTLYYKNACGGSVTPQSQTVDKSTGAKANFTVQLYRNTTGSTTRSGAYRDCDTGPGKTTPASNVTVKWEVVSGSCAGRKGTGTTDANGQFKFDLASCGGCTTDQVKVSITKVLTAVTTTKTTTPVCTSYVFLFCVNWDYETTVTTKTEIYDTYDFVVEPYLTVTWIGGCTPPPTCSTGPTGTLPPCTPTPPTGPTCTPGATGSTGPSGDLPPCSPNPPTEPPLTPEGKPSVPPSVSLVVAKTCTKSYLLIKPSTKNGTPVSMTVYVDGKRVATVKRSPFQYKLQQKSLKKGPHTVKVVVRFSDGSVVSTTKKFKPCAKLTANGRAAPKFTG